MNNANTTNVARIFAELTGLYHVCSEASSTLDGRGRGYKTKAEALRAAAYQGYTHAIGSGTTWKGVRKIPARYL